MYGTLEYYEYTIHSHKENIQYRFSKYLGFVCCSIEQIVCSTKLVVSQPCSDLYDYNNKYSSHRILFYYFFPFKFLVAAHFSFLPLRSNKCFQVVRSIIPVLSTSLGLPPGGTKNLSENNTFWRCSSIDILPLRNDYNSFSAPLRVTPRVKDQ